MGRYTFTPYGELNGHSGASTPFGCAGQYTDTESGLQYLRARYYDPSTAQFLTVDPLVGSTMEPYGYAGGNALNASDPTGMACGPIPVIPCPSHAGGALEGAGRQFLIWGFESAATFVGTTHDLLTSGQPFCVALGAGMVYANVFLLGLGPEVGAGEDLIAGGTETSLGALPDDALVVRGGLNTADRFANGTGVTVDEDGMLHNVSVNSAPGRSVADLSEGIPNGKVGVSTVGRIRAMGGEGRTG